MAKRKHDIQYFVHEGVSNMFSHGFMSFAAIGITVACLLIMGTFTLVAVNANGLLEELEKEARQLIYLRYFANKTQTEVGKELGISQVQVSRMEKKILKSVHLLLINH